MNQTSVEGGIPTIDASRTGANFKDLENAYDEEITSIPAEDHEFNAEMTDICHGTLHRGSSPSPPDSVLNLPNNSVHGLIDGNRYIENIPSPQNSLMIAAKNRSVAEVQLLLSRHYVNPDSKDKEGRTPLWHAAEGGHHDVVRVLLDRNDVDPNANDYLDGLTPLMLAALGKHEEVLQLLLSRKDIRTDIRGGPSGGTALTFAAKAAHEAGVRLLLEEDSVDSDFSNGNGYTALWCAVESGHIGVIKLLLGTDAVNLNVPNAKGETLLWWSASSGRTAIVKLLLETKGVDADTRNESGDTLL
jgi:ankyrin repeat protein